MPFEPSWLGKWRHFTHFTHFIFFFLQNNLDYVDLQIANLLFEAGQWDVTKQQGLMGSQEHDLIMADEKFLGKTVKKSIFLRLLDKTARTGE